MNNNENKKQHPILKILFTSALLLGAASVIKNIVGVDQSSYNLNIKNNKTTTMKTTKKNVKAKKA